MSSDPQSHRDPSEVLAAELKDLGAYILGAVRQARTCDQIAAMVDAKRIPSVWAADQPPRGRRPWMPP